MAKTDDETSPLPGDDQRRVARRRVIAGCLAILSVAAAVIHFAVAGSHFQEYWPFGVFMLVVGWAQLLWAVGATVRPSRPLLAGGALLNAGIIAVYVVTRTVGDVVGPTPHAIETFGFGDGLCTVLEAMIAAGCCWLLLARRDYLVRRAEVFRAIAATGGVTAVLLSAALVTGGPEMVMSVSASSPAGSSAAGHATAMHMSAPRASAAISLATRSPAGAITMPAPGMQMAPGMKMASSAPCDATPTRSQQAAAVRLVNASWKGASKYQSLAVAKAAGYRPITPVGLPVVHYLNYSSYLATIMGGSVLDLAEPQSLVYANTPRGAVLVAAMYITRPGGPTPQPGGCLTQWHLHTNLCLRPGLGVVALVSPAHPACPAGSRNRVTPPMMHIWYVPIPGGPTAIDAPDRQVVHAAEQVAAHGNGVA
jgi:hypothetical protein